MTAKGCIQGAWESWCRFWFEADFSSQLRLFRVLFSLQILYFIATRTPDLQLFYGDSGIAAGGFTQWLPEMAHRWSFLSSFNSTGMIWTAHVALLASLAALALGVWPRVFAWVAWALHVSFINRNPAVSFGVDSISTFFLLYLGLADHRAGARHTDGKATLGSVAFRFMQLQVCIIYAFSGIDKLKGASWSHGDALWYVLANPQIARWDFGWAAQFPAFLTVLTFSTLFWEVYFPALIWVRRIRYPMLVFGVGLHLSIASSMILPTFGLLMIWTYALFLEPSHAEGLTRVFRKMQVTRKGFSLASDRSYV
jgi:hypothetical protein